MVGKAWESLGRCHVSVYGYVPVEGAWAWGLEGYALTTVHYDRPGIDFGAILSVGLGRKKSWQIRGFGNSVGRVCTAAVPVRVMLEGDLQGNSSRRDMGWPSSHSR